MLFYMDTDSLQTGWMHLGEGVRDWQPDASLGKKGAQPSPDHKRGFSIKFYNKGEGDPDFNYGGAILHNIFFANLTPPRAANKPEGISKSIIDDVYGNFDKFKEAVEKEFMAAQGSNWIYMDTTGKLHTIHNHEYKKEMKIALLIDAWEHAWALDYQQDKAKYLQNIWRIINWEVVDIRLGV